MRKMPPILLLLIITLLLAPLSAEALFQKGETLPEVAGETIDGTEFSVSSLKGQPILFKIGTTWCGTCGMQSKAINEIRDFMNEKGVQFVEVFIQESASKVRKFFDKKGFELPDHVILDNGDISKRLNIYVIPRLILVDENHIVFRDGDTISAKNLKKKIEKMLAEN